MRDEPVLPPTATRFRDRGAACGTLVGVMSCLLLSADEPRARLVGAKSASTSRTRALGARSRSGRGSQRMRIAVDAMGGDVGPAIVVPGAVAGARARGVGVVLVGRRAEIEPELARLDTSGLDVTVLEAA